MFYSWKLTLVIVCTVPVLLLVLGYLGMIITKHIIRHNEELTESTKYFSEAIKSIDTVKCYNGQRTELLKYSNKLGDTACTYAKFVNLNAYQAAFVQFMGSAMFVQAFYYGGVLVNSHQKSTGEVVTTFMAALSAFSAISGIITELLVLETGRTAGATLRAIISHVESEEESEVTRGTLRPASDVGDVVMSHISFAYPTRPDRLALDNVSLQFEKGCMTFVIGRSGSGKSTLGQLLLRFYEPSGGTISIGGYNVKALDPQWLRGHFNLVEQSSTLFNDTMAHNIALGASDPVHLQKDDILAAADFALLRLVIADMTDGFDTQVGSNGKALSGGQRQRVAVARARIRDAPVLVLDEATSALDHVNRSLIMDAIRIWRKGRTTIVITHDISQIEPDDYAYILEGGRLVQEGYRKHMEKMKDSPFQNFLPPEQRAQLSPYDSRKHSALDWRARPSLAPSWPLPNIDDEGTVDIIESYLRKGENKRISALPVGLTQGLHAGLRTTTFGASFYGASPWLKLAEQTSTPSSERSPLEETPSAKDKSDEKRKSKRLSTRFNATNRAERLETFIGRTGELAAQARIMSRGRRKQQSTPVEDKSEPALLSPATNDKLPRLMPLLEIFRTVWPNLNWRYRVRLVIGFSFCAVHAATTPVMSLLVSKLIETYGTGSSGKHKALIFSLAILAIAAFDAVAQYINHFFLETTSQRWIDEVRDTIVEKTLDQPREWFMQEDASMSYLTSILDRHADQARNILGRFSSMCFIAVLMILIALIWALIVQWKLTLVAIAAAPCVWFVTKAFGTISGKWESKSNDAHEEASEIFTETFTSIRTVRALTLEKHFLDKYTKATWNCLYVGMQRALYSAFFFGLSESSGSFTQALVFYMGAKIVGEGASVSDITLVFLMLIMTITNVTSILAIIPQLSSSQDSATRFFRFANLPSGSHEHEGMAKLSHIGNLDFCNLEFTYPSRPDQTILQNVTFSVPVGTSTAIVGASGSGKSTIASLLLNLYPLPTQNDSHPFNRSEITVSGRPISHIHTPSLRSLISIVSQTPVLFSDTVANNIAYGLPIDSPYSSLTAIRNAAARAGIDDFIMSLPHGYSTRIGEGGTGVSGGQAQRIAIARALVRKPDVLVLDEATSALDVESAELIRRTVLELIETSGITVIIITHAREMMEIADQVVVLEQGRVMEKGGFKELMKRGGALTRLLGDGMWTGEQAEVVAETPVIDGVGLRDVDWQSSARSKGKGRAL